jgi:hypothetical protein
MEVMVSTVTLHENGNRSVKQPAESGVFKIAENKEAKHDGQKAHSS